MHGAGGVVVFLTNDQGVELAAGGVQRVHGGIDTQGCNVTRQHHGGIQVRKGGSGGRVGQVIRRHIHGLDGRNGADLGGRNTLLQAAHFLRQRRLVPHGGGHTTQQRGHFGTGQGVAVDVVHKEQNVFAFVAEGLGDGQTGQRHAQTVAGRLVHLAVHHGHFGFAQVLQVHHAGVGHLVIEVIAFTGTLAHTSEHGQAAVRFGDVVDQLHHVHGLAHAGATEQTHLAAFGEWTHQVDHLDTGFQQLLRGAEFVVGGRLAVNGCGLCLIYGAALVNGAAQYVHDATQGAFADRHGDRSAGVGDHQSTAQAIGATQRNRTDDAVAELLLHFQSQRSTFEFQGVVHLGHVIARELHVHHRADTLNNLSLNASVRMGGLMRHVISLQK